MNKLIKSIDYLHSEDQAVMVYLFVVFGMRFLFDKDIYSEDILNALSVTMTLIIEECWPTIDVESESFRTRLQEIMSAAGFHYKPEAHHVKP